MKTTDVDCYWLVHKNDLKYIQVINKLQLGYWLDSCNRYYEYVYICSDTPTSFSFMPHTPSSVHFFKKNNFKYMGIFSLVKERSDKIKKINESNL